MAFTVVSQPLELQPVHNKLNFIVEDGDYYAETDFKYVFKTYVEATLVDTSKLYPNLSSRAHYDASPVIRDYISRQVIIPLNATTSLLARASNYEICTYKVEFWAEYTDSNGDFQSVQRNAGTNLVAWNGVAPYHSATNMTTFTASLVYAAGSKKNYLNWKYNGWTSTEAFSDYAIPLKETDYRSVSFMAKTTANVINVHQLLVYTQTKTGTNKSLIKNLAISSSTDETHRIYHAGIGVPQLNATSWTSTSIPAGYTATISSTEDDYIAVVLRRYNGSSYDIVTNALLFKLQPITCYQFDHYTVAYQAPLGGIGYINFSKRSDIKQKNTQDTYKNILAYNYALGDRETLVHHNRKQESITLMTDWIRDQTQVTEIMDMMSSPWIMLVDNDYNLIPATVKSTDIERRKKKQDKMFTYSVEFEYAYDENTILR